MAPPKHQTPPPSEDSSDDLTSLKDVRRDIRSLGVSIQSLAATLTTQVENARQEFRTRQDLQDKALAAIQADMTTRDHQAKIEAIELGHRLKDQDKRLDSHSELVKSIPEVKRTVDSHELVLSNIRDAKKAVLMGLFERIGSYLLPALALVAVAYFGRDKFLAPSPAPTVQTTKGTAP